jgi:RNA polymerase sigma-70 factor (ECF subfamily)
MLGFSTKEQAGEMSDEDILRRSRAEPWLFAVLLDRYQAAFLRKAISIVWREEDAEEVVQDAFTKIYLNAGRFEPQPGASFSSWAYRILMNTAFTRYQKLIKEGQRFSRIDPEFENFLKDESPFSQLTEDQDRVERILDAMPVHLAAVLKMFYLERWSQQDIADNSGEDVGTIKARIHRAKAVFRKAAAGKI